MSNSKFAASDAAFQYNPSANYEFATFHNLSVKKCQNIASMLHVCNVKRYKKEELIPLILQKHIEQSNSNMVEIDYFQGIEETKGNDDNKDINLLSFNDQFKKKFNTIPYCSINKVAWFHANSVASFLEYEIPKKAIYDHVYREDKVHWYEISSKLKVALNQEHP